MLSESQLVRQIKKFLAEKYQAVCYKQHGSPYAEIGTPDILCCIHGHFMALEAKIGRNKATAAQEAQILRLARAGAITSIVRSIEDVEALIHRSGLTL